MADTDKNLYLKTHADMEAHCLFYNWTSDSMGGQCKPGSHDLNVNGLTGLQFLKSGK